MSMGSKFFGLAMLAMLSIGAGCGSPLAGSCTSLNNGQPVACVEYRDGYSAAQVMAGCQNSANVKFASEECTATSRVGRCQQSVSGNGITLSQTKAYYPPITAAQAMQDCTNLSGNGAVQTNFTAN